MTRDQKHPHPHLHSKPGRHPHDDTTSGASLPSSKLVDWRHIPFLMLDSSETTHREDAVAARRTVRDDHWSADLKMIHPLPLRGVVSLQEQEFQVCLGIHDRVGHETHHAPSVALVMAHNLTRVTDRQADALLNGRERSVTGIGGDKRNNPSHLKQIKAHLKAVRATALEISKFKDRPLTPQTTMALLSTHTQHAALEATTRLSSCPTLVILRYQGDAPVTEQECEPTDLRDATKYRIPTLVRQGDPRSPLDGLRLKERATSGAINITQIACALLGIDPIPDHLLKQGLRPDAKVDRAGLPMPSALTSAISVRRNAIRDALTSLTRELHGPAPKHR